MQQLNENRKAAAKAYEAGVNTREIIATYHIGSMRLFYEEIDRLGIPRRVAYSHRRRLNWCLYCGDKAPRKKHWCKYEHAIAYREEFGRKDPNIGNLFCWHCDEPIPRGSKLVCCKKHWQEWCKTNKVERIRSGPPPKRWQPEQIEEFKRQVKAANSIAGAARAMGMKRRVLGSVLHRAGFKLTEAKRQRQWEVRAG